MTQEHEYKSFYIIAFIALIGFFLVYFYLTTSSVRQQEEPSSLKETASIYTPPLPENIFGLAGKIVTKENNSLTLEINSLTNRTPVNGSIPKERRIVQINNSTDIKELTFSRAKLGSAPTERAIALADLVVGDQIIVTANENIIEKQKNKVKTGKSRLFIENIFAFLEKLSGKITPYFNLTATTIHNVLVATLSNMIKCVRLIGR